MQLNPPKKTKDESKKQDEPLMEFHKFMRRIVRGKPEAVKARKN